MLAVCHGAVGNIIVMNSGICVQAAEHHWWEMPPTFLSGCSNLQHLHLEQEPMPHADDAWCDITLDALTQVTHLVAMR